MRATRIAKGFQTHACHNKCNNANDTTDVVARIARIRQTKSCNRQDQKYHRPRHLTAVPFPELFKICFHNLSYLSCLSCALWLKTNLPIAYTIFSTSETGLRGFLKYGWADFPTAMTDVSISFSGILSIAFTFAVSRMPMMRVSQPWFFATSTK